MTKRIPVAVLGATGSVGQRFVQLLAAHPWFELAAVTGSERTVGRPYGEACHWVLGEPMPEAAQRLPVVESDPQKLIFPLVFSALPSGYARQLEPRFAQMGSVVCSNASAFRTEADVPILLPEVNPEHADLVRTQRQRRGWGGAIVTNPNCTSTGFTMTLAALQAAFGVRRALAVSMQAISGAGYPGVASLDILDNVIPNIEGEEEKVEWEPRKMLGRLDGEQISLADIPISAHTNRVAVSDGHMVCASLEFQQPVSPEEVQEALAAYQAPEISRDLPSAPRPAILVRSEPDRPQPRLDRWTGNGMTTVVGRIRRDPLMHVKLVVLSHNTVRGAAGGSIYNAELLVRMGFVPGAGEG
ncbi:MAG TPA: aspartate-semialdehyde dehydrogenase [Anaerolineales bacterium]|nr:aspartate-semialdehyde dehydrogenase [Anaerolineales bacterium]